MVLRHRVRLGVGRHIVKLLAVMGVTSGAVVSGCGSGVLNALPSAIPAAKGVPSGPVLGYIFSSSDGTLRPMLGVRGSAQVGQSLVPAGVYIAGDASVAGSTGLLEDAGGSLYAFNLPASQPLRVGAHFSEPVQIVFSPDGATAAVYVTGSSQLFLITGLPSNAQIQTISGSASLHLAAAAVNNAGTLVVESGLAAGILSKEGSFAPFASVASPGGLAFIGASDDVLVGDQSVGTVTVIRNVSTAPSVQPLATPGIGHPVAVASSADGRWAVIADSGNKSVLRLDLKSGSPAAALQCSCQVSQLSLLAGGMGFRISALGSGPLWTVHVAAATPQLLFVPAMQ